MIAEAEAKMKTRLRDNRWIDPGLSIQSRMLYMAIKEVAQEEMESCPFQQVMNGEA